MSVQALSWARVQRVGDQAAKAVLRSLADQANADGVCWPGIASIAVDCELHPRTVQRKIHHLEQLGLLVRKQRSGQSTLYALQFAITLALEPAEGWQSAGPGSRPGRQPATDPRQSAAGPPAEGHPNRKEPSRTVSGGARAPRPRDELWEELELLFGRVEPRTNAHAKRNKAVADLKRLGASADSVRQAARRWERTFQASLTDVALATHYPQLAHRPSFEPASRAPACPKCGIGGGAHLEDCPQTGSA